MTKEEEDDGFAQAMCDYIAAGYVDRNIERLLAALHDRKRALRSVPGFVRRDR